MNTLTVFPKRMSYAPLSFNSILNEVFNDNFFGASDYSHSTPMVNIKETKDGYHLEVAAPGLSKENFSITMEKDLLTISGEKQTEQKQEGEKFTRKEFNYGSFQRSFSLPEEINQEAIDAKYENGILKIALPKKEESKKPAKEIKVS